MNSLKYDLLNDLCGVFAPSGHETAMKKFILNYVEQNKHTWACQPDVIYGKEFHDCVILKFGQPRTAILTHMDSIGFTVRYNNQLVPIGGPDIKDGYTLVGRDSLGEIECALKTDVEHRSFYHFGRGIDRGTQLVFKPDFRETDEFVQCCYLDNRLGVFVSLQLAKILEDGVLVFSCREEHGGGTVPFLCKYLYEKLNVSQTLICDITWITDGVEHGKGAAISMRDDSIPRKAYLDRIISIADQHAIPYQLEVEGHGGSDGKEVQASPYPIDWCFVGAAEDHVHSPDEIVHKSDIESMINLYSALMQEL